MNIAIIFAGGTGTRMNTKACPKQFLELHGKPILIYTLEEFEKNEQIDAIVLVMLDSYIEKSKLLINKYAISKVSAVVSGGSTCQESIFCGITKAKELYPEDSILLIHDGVRPLVDQETINKCIECTKRKGNAITVAPAIETIVYKDEKGGIKEIIDRSRCQLAKAPQGFILKDIYQAHLQSRSEGRNDFIDSASLMKYYGFQLNTIEGSLENIKITTPGDFYVFRAIADAKESSQIWGL